MTRRGAAAARRAHNPEVAGATPAGATTLLTDTLVSALLVSALREADAALVFAPCFCGKRRGGWRCDVILCAGYER